MGHLLAACLTLKAGSGKDLRLPCTQLAAESLLVTIPDVVVVGVV